jgi:hypothetical protein
MSTSSDFPLATTPSISQQEAPTFWLTLLHTILFTLPLLTASLSQLSLHSPLVKPISISAAILMTLILAQAFTKLARFRHPAGVLLQAINWHVIITYSFINWYTGECTISHTHIKRLHNTIADLAMPWQLGAASVIAVGCILYISVIAIVDTIFWVVVAYGHSEEELGLYARVQDGLGWVWARLSLLGLGLFAGMYLFKYNSMCLLMSSSSVIRELFTCREPSTQTGTMTPPPVSVFLMSMTIFTF